MYNLIQIYLSLLPCIGCQLISLFGSARNTDSKRELLHEFYEHNVIITQQK